MAPLPRKTLPPQEALTLKGEAVGRARISNVENVCLMTHKQHTPCKKERRPLFPRKPRLHVP